MPTADTALVYPGGCLLEGTNLSDGRGTIPTGRSQPRVLSACIAVGCGGPPSGGPDVTGEARQAATVCVTIQRGLNGVVKDTYLHQGHPTSSFGASGDMYSGVHSSGALQRAMVHFDLSAIPPGAEITSADMRG